MANDFMDIKTIIRNKKERLAKQLGWDSLSEEDKNNFTKLASEQVDKEMAVRAREEWDKACKAFDDPSFVSRGPK